jgi:hypothetical protein
MTTVRRVDGRHAPADPPPVGWTGSSSGGIDIGQSAGVYALRLSLGAPAHL